MMIIGEGIVYFAAIVFTRHTVMSPGFPYYTVSSSGTHMLVFRTCNIHICMVVVSVISLILIFR